MNDSLSKVARAGIGIVLVVVLLGVVNRWWGDYRTAAADAKGSMPATSTAAASATAKPKPAEAADDEKKSDKKKKSDEKMVVILEDGVNFREDPTRAAKIIRALDEDEKLTLLGEQGAWYNVEDDKGTKGWVTSNSLYSKVK